MATTRDRIVTATNELFRRQGFHATGLQAVAAAADAPIGSIYHHFPGGKTELGAAVMTETGAVYAALFDAIAEEAADPADAVGRFFDGAAVVLEESDFIDVCPIGSVARETASTLDPVRTAAAGVFVDWIEGLASRCRDHGMAEAGAHAVAETVVAALEGGFVLARTARDADELRRIGTVMRDLVAAHLATTRPPARVPD